MVRTILARDGVMGFRLISRAMLADLRRELGPEGWRIDIWNVMAADAAAARSGIAPLLARPLPDGIATGLLDGGAGDAAVRGVQAFLAEQGIAPFPGARLTGEGCEARTLVLRSRDGSIAATAHCYFPHGRHSPHARDAWVGLVAVAPEFRGSGLGTRANAEAIRLALDDLGAAAVHELVSETNVPSRRMMERCGLVPDSARVCAMAVRAQAEKFTR